VDLIIPRAPYVRKAASAPPEGTTPGPSESDLPPNCNLGPWSAIDGSTETWLQFVSEQRDGLYSFKRVKYTVSHDAEKLKTIEPHHSRNAFPHRTSFGYFPEFHRWFKINHSTDYSGQMSMVSVGYLIPILICVFHEQPNCPDLRHIPPSAEGASSIKNKTRDVPEIQNVDEDANVPNPKLRVLGPNDPQTDDEADEPEIPAVVAERSIVQAGDSPALGEDEPNLDVAKVDWSTFDLGTTLRSLKSEDRTAIIRAIRKLHLRFWHASSKK
jgi:hypothetical protein